MTGLGVVPSSPTQAGCCRDAGLVPGATGRAQGEAGTRGGDHGGLQEPISGYFWRAWALLSPSCFTVRTSLRVWV